MNQPKVFCIGFHKTGTSSLGRALRQLGYRVTGPNDISNPNVAQEVYATAFKLVEEFDAFRDNPWPLLYKELDQRYPGSKFIFTMRPADSWIKSVVVNFGRGVTPMREWIYGVGCPKGNEAIYLERYERHNREVLEHFRGRRDNFLALEITAGEGWEKLCEFLNKTAPDAPFPHVNTAVQRKEHFKKLQDSKSEP